MNGYEELANAIVQQAAEDYAVAVMGGTVNGKKPQDVMKECEKFFHSKWYESLTGGMIDGE